MPKSLRFLFLPLVLFVSPLFGQSPGGVSSNLRAWYSGGVGVFNNAGTTLAANGDNVQQWNDQSGLGFNITQATLANRPVFSTSSINGYPALTFSSNQWLDMASAPGITSGFNFFIVFRPTAFTAGGIGDGAGSYLIDRTAGNNLTSFKLVNTNRLGFQKRNDNNTGLGGPISTTAVVANTTFLADYYRNPGTEYGINIYGRNEAVIADDLGVLTGPILRFGRHVSTVNGGLTGQIAEIVVYNSNLSATERQRINSYLAIKYGVSLSQTTALNYLASNGSILWNGTTHSGYGNNMTAVGRDNNSGLNQLTSKSVNPGSVLRVTTSSLGSDLDFVFVGDDNGSLAPTTATVPSPYFMRTTRIWKSVISGTPGSVSLSFDLGANAVYNSGNPGDYAVLIKSGDSNFSSGATIHTGGASIVGNVLTFTNVPVTDGSFISLALPNVASPGGIVDGLRVWLKANSNVFSDAGVTPAVNGGTVSQWSDNSYFGNNAAATGTPTYFNSTNLINNNPTVYYNGSSGHNLSYSGVGQYSIFTVSRMDGTQNRRVFSSRTGNALLGYWNGREDVLYLDANPSFLTGSVASTSPKLFSLIRSSSGSYVMNRSGGSLYSGATSFNSTWQMGIGNGGSAAGEPSAVFVPEYIQYDRDLTSAEQLRVHSYLAMKYGFTLDQTIAQNYVSSDATVIWDAAVNVGFISNITAIGRDDLSGLDQRISTNINTTASITLTKTGAFATNKSFIVTGDNNTTGTSSDVASSFDFRSARVWRTNVTGSPGTIGLSVDLALSGFPVKGVASDYAMLIDSDGNFATGATVHTTGATLVGNVLSFTGVTLSGNEFLAIASSNISSPGGVAGQLAVWLKANDGLEEAVNDPAESGDVINRWVDKGGSVNNYLAAGGSPTFVNNALNFNPMVEMLTGGFDAPVTTTLNANHSLFFVSQKLASDINGRLFETSTSNYIWAYWTTFRNAIYYNANPNVINTGIATQSNVTDPYIFSYKRESASTSVEARTNGVSLATYPTSNFIAGLRIDINNGAFAGSEHSDARVGEMIVFHNTLTALEMARIESYLAIKYGLTLGSNYLASNGTTLWDLAANTGYNTNIAGVGRDDLSGLDQQISTGASSTGALTIDLGGAPGIDRSFILWGDNALSGTVINNPSSYVARTQRIWRTRVTGTPGNASSLSINVLNAGFALTSAASDYVLLVDTDTDFSSGATEYVGGSLVGNVVTFTNVVIPDNSFISLANSVISLPGGVAGSVFWVKADAGVNGVANITQWTDQSGSNNHAVQATVANQPELLSSTINYNQAVQFVGNEFLSLTTAPANLNSTIFTAGAPTANTTWRTLFRGTVNDHPIIIQSGGNTLGYYDNDNVGLKSGGFNWLENEVAIVGTEFRSGDVNFRKNGTQGASNNTITLTGLNLNHFGNYQAGGQPFGRVAETIIFNSGTALTSNEKDRIESYLAIKYGSTLTHNYLSAGGTVTWDIASQPNYNSNIVGIGRDDLTSLDQRQSKSTQSRSVLILNSGGLLPVDESFIIAGSTNTLLTPTATNAHPSFAYRLTREWVVQTTGTPGSISVSFDLGDGIYNTTNAADYALLIKSGDNNFTSGATAITTGSFTGNVLTFTGISLSDNDFITLGMPRPPAPGGVVEGLHWWLKADQGVVGAGTASVWNDQSGNGFNVSQTTVANQPVIVSNGINDYPTLQFDGTNDNLNLTGGILGTRSYNNAYAFIAGKSFSTTSNNFIFRELTSGSEQFNIHLPFSNGFAYWDAGNFSLGNRIAVAWGGTVSQPFIFTFTGSTTATPSGARQDIYRNGLRIANDNTMIAYSGFNNNMLVGTQPAEIGEIVYYSGALNTTDFQKIQSYLALKYGNSLNQTVPADYLASSGASIFKTTTSQVAYSKDIAGIGRDDNSALDLRKSRSTNGTIADIVTLANGNFATPVAFTNNLGFVVWGHNGLPLSSSLVDATITHNSVLIERKLTRTWSTEVTGTLTGNAIFEFDMSTVSGPTGPGTNATADLRLLIDSDATFGNSSAGENVYAVSSVSGGKVYFTVPYSDLTTGTGFFTIGSTNAVTASLYRPAPGGISADLRLWLKSDAGVIGGATVSAWQDQSSYSHNLVQATGANQPTVAANRINNNSTVTFDGTNDDLRLSNGILKSNTYSDVYVYSIASTGLVKNAKLFAELNLAGTYLGGYIPWGDNNVYWDAGDWTASNRLSGNWGGTINTPYLWSFGGSTTSTPSGVKQDVFRNARRFLNDNTMNTFTGNNNQFVLGSELGSNFYNGEVAEFIVVTSPLNLVDQQRVHSYLALKYGITLDQTTPQDYYSATNSVIYHSTTSHASYRADIAGIGRDDYSLLDQRKSKSVNAYPQDILSIGNEDFTTPAAFATDQSFLVWGNNSKIFTSDLFQTPYTHSGSSIVRQLLRVWSLDKTGNPGTTAVVQLNMNQVYGPTGYGTNNTADIRLLLDDDGTFGNASAGEKSYSISSEAGGFVYFQVPYADIPTGQSFVTLGSVNAATAPLFQPSPGGVTSDLRLWLKAGSGVTGGGFVSAWADQSAYRYNATQGTGANQPAVLSGRVNGNPSISFDGTNDDLSISTGIFQRSTLNDVFVYSFHRVNQLKGSRLIREANSSGGVFTVYAPSSDANLYWDAGDATANNRLTTNWGSSVGQSNLWSFSASNSTTPNGFKQDIERNGRLLNSDNTFSPVSGNNNAFTIGSDPGGNYLNSEITEMAIITSNQTAIDRQRIHSYFAIKYGLTLDQTTPQNYFSSLNANIYHSTTTHASYRTDIAGIGRDDNSLLDQRKSASINSPADVVAIANGDFTTPTSFSSSNEFLIWGHNAKPYFSDATFSGYSHNGSSIVRQIARVWSTDKTNSPSGNAVIEINTDLLGGPSGLGTNANTDLRLLFDNDATFGNASAGEGTYSPDAGFAASGGKIYFTVPYASIPSGQGFFTLGSVNATTASLQIVAPGGVAANLKLWLKANAGVSGGAVVTSWADQSVNGFSATQGTVASQPAVTSNALNFNTGITFDGTNDQLQITGGILANNTYTETQMFTVATVGSVPRNQSIYWENTAAGGRLNAHVPEGTSVRWDPGSSVNRLSVAWGGTANVPYLWTFNSSTAATTTGNKTDIYRDGGLLASGALMTTFTGNYSTSFVGSIGNNYYHQGVIGEVAIYSSALTATEQRRINSYLALKYGLTLAQSTPQNYLASNGTVLYDAVTTNSGYRSDIAGIGRDDASGLDQRKSQSVNTKSAVQLDKGGAFTSNLDFIVWGSNGQPLTYTAANTPATYDIRLSRIWRADITGTPGTITVSFDLSPGVIRNSGSASDYRMAVKNANADFATGATLYSGALVGNTLLFTNVSLADGDYFTLLLTSFPAPGGVVENMKYWIKADAGVIGTTNASGWDDQSGNGFNVAQGTVASQPTIISPRLNFNPSIQFDGANDQLTLASGILGTTTYSDIHAIYVSRVNTISTSSIFFENAASSGRINVHGPWSDSQIYWDAGGTGATQRQNVAWGGALATNFVWSTTASTTLAPGGALQEIYRNGLRIRNDATMSTFTGNNSSFSIGSGGGGNYFNGEISELVLYTGVMSQSQLQRIHSYMAIKYGLTLDQTAPTNYFASDWNGTTGTVIWNATTAGTYRTDIAVIGRDDDGAINQKQSASSSATNILAIGNGTIDIDNATNSNSFTADKSFMAWAHNNAAAAGAGVTDFGTTVNAETIRTRFARAWQVQETGTVGTVKIRFNLSSVGGVLGVLGANDLNDVRLLVDTDGTFATGATSISASSLNNATDIVEFDHNFTAGTGFFFTLGSVNLVTAPLPVELIYLTAVPENDRIRIEWKTATEKNNSHFILEASADARTWNPIARVAGQGDKQIATEYLAYDSTPFIGNNYYRLVQYDFDGKFTQSKIVQASFDNRYMYIYPNPMQNNQTNLVVSSGYKGYMNLKVINGLGVEVLTRLIDNREPHRQNVFLTLDGLASGIYLVQVKAGNETFQMKIIKP